jgi:hypothetical protein
MHRLPRPTPAFVVALAALFFALGGTAFAVGVKSAPPQPRCTTGAIRAIAVVTGGEIGLDSLPNTYTSDPSLFGYRWNCTGGQIAIRKPVDYPGVELQFSGNPANVAIVSSDALGVPNAGSVKRGADGGFYVTMGGSNVGVPGPWQFQSDVPFTIVLF